MLRSRGKADQYLVIFFKLISFFLTTIPPNWGHIKHTTSKLNECTPVRKRKWKVKTNINEESDG